MNINKLATLRNARGGNNPNLAEWVKKIQTLGAHGITIHPRPDERHIKKSDVYEIKPLITTELNIEGYPSSEFINLIKEIKPNQATLVPDGPDVITSNAGWDIIKNKDFLTSVANELKSICRISVFVEPKTITLEAAKICKNIGVKRAELYTEEFASNYNNTDIQKKYRSCADILLNAGLELNAGHDLDLNNLKSLITLIPEIKEVSIGHALICESLEFGMSETIHRYLEILK